MSIKRSKIDIIKEEFVNEGYQMIDGTYDPKTYKCEILCPLNHRTSVNCYDWKSNQNKCQKCPKLKFKKRKITIEVLQQEFAEVGYKLLTNEYISYREKLDYECDKGHLTNISYASFKKGIRCNKCSKRPVIDIEWVREEFEKVGYRLISNKYVRAIAKLDYECDKGHVTKISYNDLQQGRRCNKCSGKYQMTYDEIKKFYKNRNYVLLSPESDYRSYQSTLKFKCDKGHVNDMKFMSIRNGYKCSICTGNKKLTYEFVKEEFAKQGYILITKKYTNARTLMKFRCVKGNHNHQMTYSDIKQRYGCGKCSGKAKLEYDVVSKAFEDVGYTLLSKIYKNSHQKLKIKCNEGHITTITYTHFKSSSRRCSLCSQSNGERAIQEYLDACSLVIDYTPQKSFDNCQTVHRKRYDFEVLFATGTRFLIEYDGRQHFTPIEFFGGQKSLKSNRRRDLLKTNYCRKHKIPLLRISYRHIGKIPEILENFMIKVSIDPHVIHFTDEDLYEHLMV